MLDHPTPLSPVWAGQLVFGGIVRFRFPDPLDRQRRPVRFCAVSATGIHHGALFVELLPAVPASEAPPEASDIPLAPPALIPALQAGCRAQWLRPALADRFDADHPGFRPGPVGDAPIVGRLTGPAHDALAEFHAHQQAQRAAHIARWRARRRPPWAR